MQSVQAMDSLFSRIMANIVLPLSGPENAVETMCSGVRGAARIKALSMLTRPHNELWDDEKKRSSFNLTQLGFFASLASAIGLCFAMKRKYFGVLVSVTILRQ
jgi:hypothetical protein